MVAAAVIAGILSFGQAAFAWEEGSLKIVPAFKSEGQWDSNIFYDEKDAHGDFISLLTPGIAGELGFGTGDKNKLKAAYSCEAGLFAKYDDQKYANQTVDGGVALDFDEYTLDVNDNFQFTSSRAGTEFDSRTLRRLNTLDTVLGAHFNKIDFDFGYKLSTTDYVSKSLDSIDYYENSLWTTGYIEVAPKTKSLLEFTYSNIQYPDGSGRDGNTYRVMAGVEGNLTSKLTGIIKGGVKTKIYDSDVQNDFLGPVANAMLVYNVNKKVDCTLSYTREAFEAVYSNNNFYVGDQFISGITYKFGDGFTAKLDGQYFLNSYTSPAAGESKKRVDNEWGLTPGLDYAFNEWLSSGIYYKFHQRESNIAGKDYDQHVIGINAMVKF
jgi:hypothetical protein